MYDYSGREYYAEGILFISIFLIMSIQFNLNDTNAEKVNIYLQDSFWLMHTIFYFY